jgi:hypothetical protein
MHVDDGDHFPYLLAHSIVIAVIAASESRKLQQLHRTDVHHKAGLSLLALSPSRSTDCCGACSVITSVLGPVTACFVSSV